MKKLKIFSLSALLALSTVTHAQSTSELEKTFSTMEKRDQTIETFLKDNSIKNVKGSPEGIYYTVEVAGMGGGAKPGDYVTVHYTGTLLDGSKFDSSVDRGQPFSFQIGTNRVIQGWEKGIPLFGKGGKGKLYLPSQLAYGDRAVGNRIQANSPLIFEIEVLDIMPAEQYFEMMKAEQMRQQQTADSLAKIQMVKDAAIIRKYAADNKLELQYHASGLAFTIEKNGDGKLIQAGNQATVHYAGFLLDGTKFDASYDRNEPFTLPVGAGQVISGWEIALQLMSKGEKRRFYLPSTLAYGSRGAGGVIPPDAVLIFDIEVLDVK